ncbi:unnamed protein product [Tenebrio molitor]|nr:unnamed protein product [Tenebrio molitor]
MAPPSCVFDSRNVLFFSASSAEQCVHQLSEEAHNAIGWQESGMVHSENTYFYRRMTDYGRRVFQFQGDRRAK